MRDSLGIYISVPFCTAKCTYCNFASGVFGVERMEPYVERVCAEIAGVRGVAAAIGAELPTRVDTIFLGGGTPSLLSGAQMRKLFASLRNEFDVVPDAEITMECAPGQLSEETLVEALRLGMSRISFGVQSFVDAEAATVGRLHTRAMCLAEIERLRVSGITAINVDLIAGLPGQTAASWRKSVEVAIESGVPHISVYMLEVDEDSRLGREMLNRGGSSTQGLAARYGAARAPSEDETAEWYAAACQWLEAAGVRQYEISNFAREGHTSRHNIKYWRREPYAGFGLDAHSMLRTNDGAARWANTSELEDYLADDVQNAFGLRDPVTGIEWIGKEQGFEESMFLGLRLNDGVDIAALQNVFGAELVTGALQALQDVQQAGLVAIEGGRVVLTANGRMASNEVFGRLLVPVA